MAILTAVTLHLHDVLFGTHLKFTAFNSSNLYDELMTVNFHENRVVLPNKTNCYTKLWSNSMEKCCARNSVCWILKKNQKGICKPDKNICKTQK